jgi:ATP-dependent DNA helicase RecG
MAQSPVGIQALMEPLEQANRSRFRKNSLTPLLDMNWLKMTIPDKPTSSKQRYQTTDAGMAWLKNQGEPG